MMQKKLYATKGAGICKGSTRELSNRDKLWIANLNSSVEDLYHHLRFYTHTPAPPSSDEVIYEKALKKLKLGLGKGHFDQNKEVLVFTSKRSHDKRGL